MRSLLKRKTQCLDLGKCGFQKSIFVCVTMADIQSLLVLKALETVMYLVGMGLGRKALLQQCGSKRPTELSRKDRTSGSQLR